MMPIDVGSEKQLFLDDLFTASARGVNLVVNPPRKTGEKLLVLDKPWEGPQLGMFASILQDDDGLLKVWYQAYDCGAHTGKDMMRICQAVSQDGIHWEKPALGIHEYDGSLENNIVIVGTGYGKKRRVDGLGVFKDRNPKAPPHMRYRAPYLKLNGFVSADGIHWVPGPDSKGGVQHCSGDTQAAAFWDQSVGRYVYYTRRNVWKPAGPGEQIEKYGQSSRINIKEHQVLRRHVLRAESDDFVTWTEGVEVLAVDDADSGHDFMTSNVLKYPLADRAYILLTSYYHYTSNTFDMRLAVSRDGIHFTRPGRDKPFIPLGEAGSFDARQILEVAGFVRMGDEIWIYTHGCDFEHQQVWERKSKLGFVFSRAIQRLDGYISMDAGPEASVLTSVPIVFRGDRLELNVETSKKGAVEVELFDAGAMDTQGEPTSKLASSEQFTGDSVRALMKWRESLDLKELAGRRVVLRFTMRDAKLYAFQFARG